MISTGLNFDIRSLNIEARGEVFTCELAVMVTNRKVVSDLCDKVKKISGIKRADRI